MLMSSEKYELQQIRLREVEAEADGLRDDAMLMRRLKNEIRGISWGIHADQDIGQAHADKITGLVREITGQANRGE